ncbi:hypothetical protein [Salinimicrobium marinum]|nr:hypothetical protein [Salinimicrobium marinum]
MKRILFFLSVIFVVTLSYLIPSSEFMLLVLIALALLFLLVCGFILIFKNINRRYFKIPLLIIGICFLGVVVSLFRPYEKSAVMTSGSLGKKLQYAYETDQNDRKQLRSFIGLFSKLNERDDKRLTQVKELSQDRKLLKPMDKFYAAFIYHHSDNSTDYETASKLSAQAAESEKLQDHYQVQWLKKAAYDRYMVSLGKPEKYNTQNSFGIKVE